MSYKLHELVRTSKGKGVVVYAEEGYVEVDVNGVEMGYDAPFTGLSLWSEPSAWQDGPRTQPEQLGDVENADAVVDLLPGHFVRAGQLYHLLAARAVSSLGGSAATWDDLTGNQKLNFIALATGFGKASMADHAMKPRDQDA